MSDWKKARGCGDNACIEVNRGSAVVQVRDSSDESRVLLFTVAEFDTFLAGVKAGDFDPPSLPPEPDPGAYMIGDTWVLTADPRVIARAWLDAEGEWFDWTWLWAKHGGPDVQITPLVPMPAVELPLIEEWYGRDVRVTRTIPTGDFVHVGIDNDFAHLTDDQAERLGAALIAAARAARDRSGT